MRGRRDQWADDRHRHRLIGTAIGLSAGWTIALVDILVFSLGTWCPGFPLVDRSGCSAERGFRRLPVNGYLLQRGRGARADPPVPQGYSGEVTGARRTLDGTPVGRSPGASPHNRMPVRMYIKPPSRVVLRCG